MTYATSTKSEYIRHKTHEMIQVVERSKGVSRTISHFFTKQTHSEGAVER